MLAEPGRFGRWRSPTGWGLLAGVLLMLSADAAHWFFTPHPDATSTRMALVAAQLVLCALGALWAWRRGKHLEGGVVVPRKEAPPG